MRNVNGAYTSVHQCRILCTARHQKQEQGFVEGSAGAVGQLFKLVAIKIILSRDAVCWHVTLGPNCRQKEEFGLCFLEKPQSLADISLSGFVCVMTFSPAVMFTHVPGDE